MKRTINTLALFIVIMAIASFTIPNEVPTNPEIDLNEVQAMVYQVAKYGHGIEPYIADSSTWRPVLVANDNNQYGAYVNGMVYTYETSATQLYSKGVRFDLQLINGNNPVLSRGTWHVELPIEIE